MLESTKYEYIQKERCVQNVGWETSMEDTTHGKNEK
jgi:hypothetical protein